jgi:gamma-glutamylcysteine synthetase
LDLFSRAKQSQFLADAKMEHANRMRLIQNKCSNKMKAIIHIGLSNTKCQDRTPQLFKSRLLHKITQSQLNQQRDRTGNSKIQHIQTIQVNL